MEPAACFAPGGDLAQIEAGRALFNAPQLLGGQAARADLSCASCHSNGRRNPHFFLDGVSDIPGSADVTASFFSAARGNGVFDPKPIPDLALPGRVSHDPASGELERFLRGLIVEEFSGSEPSPSVLAALATYVRALEPCETEQDQPRTLAEDVALVQASVRGAGWFAERGERDPALMLIRGARHQLGLIDERYPMEETLHSKLLRASRELLSLHDSPELSNPALDRWLSRFERGIVPQLRRRETHSLYNPAGIAGWVAAELAERPAN